MKNYSKIKNTKGFTLLELLIVIAIMIILLSVGMVSLIPVKRSAILKSAQNEVTSAIKLAQSYALQGKIIGSGLDAPCRYGFMFTDNDTYKIFYDQNCTGTESLVETRDLKSGAYLSNPASGNSSKITFSVPHGEVRSNNIASFGSADFTFRINGVGATVNKTITIYDKGLITAN